MTSAISTGIHQIRCPTVQFAKEAKRKEEERQGIPECGEVGDPAEQGWLVGLATCLVTGHRAEKSVVKCKEAHNITE